MLRRRAGLGFRNASRRPKVWTARTPHCCPPGRARRSSAHLVPRSTTRSISMPAVSSRVFQFSNSSARKAKATCPAPLVPCEGTSRPGAELWPRSKINSTDPSHAKGKQKFAAADGAESQRFAVKALHGREIVGIQNRFENAQRRVRSPFFWRNQPHGAGLPIFSPSA